MTRSDARRPPPRRLRRFVLRLLGLAVAAAVVAAGALAVLVVATPSVADAADRVASQASTHGAHVETTVPTRVAAALIATEDSRFATDPGIDPLGVLRWAGGTIQGRSDAGGATLDQQLAKLLYTDGRQDPLAQAEQVGLALKLAHTYSRPRILELYLSTAYFGHGYYGVTAAAEGYFHRSPDALTWPQAALLAGLVQAPSAYDPVVHPDLARSRRGHVLARLVATGMLTEAQAAVFDRGGLQLAAR
ncbi:MAG TPA: biosynthetic peptidoglycan transglycosylase [Amnibacterium sp.]|jgi:penicillin-binding protein 1A|uniref:biosynthetic peptidoglycan transglycosylase n=1 Tax=Amnibacterium sp. TaxID=1872496 RepID=UPI002F94A01C